MFHYLFTNDLRISMLDSSLKKAGMCFVTDTVPSATQDKAANNNMKTLGFYFNLTQQSNCAKEAQNGNIRKVVLNFIKKFQFPNYRTKESFENCVSDGIKLAPMRTIIKILYAMNMLYNKSCAYLTKEEVKYFIFYNEHVAKSQFINIVEVINDILSYRKNGMFPSYVSTEEAEHEWKHEDRQLREMINILLWSGCVQSKDNKLFIVDDDLSRENKADIYEIVNYNDFWNGKDLASYQEYMDIEAVEKEEDSLDYLYSLNNKDFAFECLKIMKKNKVLTDENVIKLTDKQFSSQTLKNTFPVLKRIEILDGNEGFEEQFRDLKGHSRYYTENVDINGSRFAITNNWYYGGEKAIDTRTPFIEWIRNEIGNKECKKMKMLTEIIVTAPEIPVPYNYLLFGAPGTGKSHELDKLQKLHFGEDDYERVTFYPNYSYQNFVGTYKPCMKNNEICYEYVPGPFIRTLEQAYKNPERNFLLIIEELNRANPAAVFGDAFQLLDRKEGVSEYSINTSEDLKLYFAKRFVPEFDEIEDEEQKNEVLDKFKKMYIPRNMYIWATMNSADQGVFLIDTAFKRRWGYDYLDINTNQDKIADYVIPIGNGKYVKWNVLRKAINEKLSSEECKVNEDKLLGTFFVSENMLKTALIDEDKFVKAFNSKVLMYLFEDAMKMSPKKIFAGHKGRMLFSEICKAYGEMGVELFGFDASMYVPKP